VCVCVCVFVGGGGDFAVFINSHNSAFALYRVNPPKVG
jgi:hypothetical protein